MRSRIRILFSVAGVLAALFLGGPRVCQAEMLYPVIGTLDGFSGDAVHIRQSNLQYFVAIRSLHPKTLARLKRMKQDAKVMVWAPTAAIQLRKMLPQKRVASDDDDEETVKQPESTPLVSFNQWYYRKKR